MTDGSDLEKNPPVKFKIMKKSVEYGKIRRMAIRVFTNLVQIRTRCLGILVSEQFKTEVHPLPSFETFEAISARIRNNLFSGVTYPKTQ